jgi:hypothetical protein
MNALSPQKVIQANSPKFLEEEVARFAKEGWRKTGEPVEIVSAELGRPTYWAQTLGLGEPSASRSSGSARRLT